MDRVQPKTVQCHKCKERAIREFSLGGMQINGPIIQTNIGPKPMRFENKKHLARYCNEHKIYSGALL